MLDDKLKALRGSNFSVSFAEKVPGFLCDHETFNVGSNVWLSNVVGALNKIVVEYRLCYCNPQQIREFFRCCFLALRPKGVLLIGEPDPKNTDDEYVSALKTHGALLDYDRRVLSEMLQKAGFFNIEVLESMDDGVLRYVDDSDRKLINRCFRPQTPRRNSLVLRARKGFDFSPSFPDYFGHSLTLAEHQCIDQLGRPTPWFTYPAILFLSNLDFSDKMVFEYGCGNSTLFWGARAKTVTAVEDNEQWFARINERKLPNTTVLLGSGIDYVGAIKERAPYDVVVVDGAWRYDCAMEAIKYTREDGLIILDNSERYPVIAAELRKGRIQVDMSGPGPLNEYIWSTSLFFGRTADFKPLGDVQPAFVPGAVDSIEVRPGYAAVNKPGLY